MDQSDFAPQKEERCQEILLEQQANTSNRSGDAAATKSNCIDCDCVASNNHSPLFVPASSFLGPTSSKAPFASLVERAKFIW